MVVYSAFTCILDNEQYLCIILCNCLCSLKVKVKNIQVELLEAFLIFEDFFLLERLVISQPLLAPGVNMPLILTDPQRATSLALLEVRCSLLDGTSVYCQTCMDTSPAAF